MALSEQLDVSGLRRKVRATQHVRSVPLIGIGILLVNYGTNLFAPSPVEWRYGAPLAFVAIWALMKANESLTGVGGRRADYLIAAGFVFTASNLVLTRPFSRLVNNPYRVQGIWVLIVGIALVAVAVAAGDWLVGTAAAVVCVAGAIMFVRGPNWQGLLEYVGNSVYRQQPLGDVLLVAVGALMVLAGIITYRNERRAA
jgi:hypothetical protein